MDIRRWAPVPSDLPISSGSSTSVDVLSDRQQLAVTNIGEIVSYEGQREREKVEEN